MTSSACGTIIPVGSRSSSSFHSTLSAFSDSVMQPAAVISAAIRDPGVYSAYQQLPLYLACRHNTLSPYLLRHTSSHQPGSTLPRSSVTSFMDVPCTLSVTHVRQRPMAFNTATSGFTAPLAVLCPLWHRIPVIKNRLLTNGVGCRRLVHVCSTKV